MRYWLSLLVLLIAAPALAQQSVIPYVVTGGGSGGPVTSAPVGYAPGTGMPTIVNPSASASVGITPVAATSAVASLVLKATPGNFYSASAANVTATAGFCLVINAVSAPTTGSSVTPIFFATIPANGTCSISTLGGPPAVFSAGIVFLVSSNASPFTFTSGAITAAISGMVQ